LQEHASEKFQEEIKQLKRKVSNLEKQEKTFMREKSDLEAEVEKWKHQFNQLKRNTEQQKEAFQDEKSTLEGQLKLFKEQSSDLNHAFRLIFESHSRCQDDPGSNQDTAKIIEDNRSQMAAIFCPTAASELSANPSTEPSANPSTEPFDVPSQGTFRFQKDLLAGNYDGFWNTIPTHKFDVLLSSVLFGLIVTENPPLDFTDRQISAQLKKDEETKDITKQFLKQQEEEAGKIICTLKERLKEASDHAEADQRIFCAQDFFSNDSWKRVLEPIKILIYLFYRDSREVIEHSTEKWSKELFSNPKWITIMDFVDEVLVKGLVSDQVIKIVAQYFRLEIQIQKADESMHRVLKAHTTGESQSSNLPVLKLFESSDGKLHPIIKD